MKKIIMGAALALALPGMANALVIADDFNDGSLSGWTVQNGSVVESGGTVSGSDRSLMTMDGQTGSTLGVDAISNPRVDYVSLVLNYSSLTDNLFVKIQDNNSNGLFDRVFFYHGNNGGAGLVGGSFFDLDFEVQSTYFEVSDNGDGTASAFVGATNQTFSGILANSYTGTGVGLGFYGNGEANNFYLGDTAAVSEPGTLALLGLGLAGLGLSRRKKAD